MDCRRIADEQIAERYLNGRLEEPLQDEFEVHILECPTCLQSVETLQELRTAVASQAPQIRLAPKPHTFRFRYWSFAAVALATVVGIGVLQWRRHKVWSGEGNIARQQSPVPSSAVVTPGAEATGKAQGNAPLAAVPSPLPRKDQPLARPVPVPHQGNPTESASSQPIFLPTAAPPGGSQTTTPSPETTAANPPEVRREWQKKQTELTSAQALELYQLAEVRAAPYSFSGLTAGAASPARRTGAVEGRAAADAGSAIFQHAMVAYVEGRYQDANGMLESAAQADPKAPNVNFYLGVCRLLLGHPDDAIPVLTRVTEEGKSRLVQPAHVYLAKAYLQRADLKHAEVELAAASTLPGPLKGEANSLLQRVRSLRTAVEKAPQASSPTQK